MIKKKKQTKRVRKQSMEQTPVLRSEPTSQYPTLKTVTRVSSCQPLHAMQVMEQVNIWKMRSLPVPYVTFWHSKVKTRSWFTTFRHSHNF